MNDNETIADIIAEMRGMGNYQRYSGDHARVLAGRIEAAHKRERGDCAKLREALEQVQKKINYLIGNLTVSNSLVANRMEINGIINAALAAPPRNCDKVKTSWDVLKKWHEGLDTANDIVRMLDWLLAPATEKEGGAK